MSADLESRALDLALVDAPLTGDAELDAAVAGAAEDIAAIRTGLALIADEMVVPEVERRSARKPGRRVWASVAVAVVLAAVGGWITLSGGGPGSRTSSPHFRTDTFNYRPGGLGSGAAFPFLGYEVPRLSDVSASSSSDAWIVGSIAWHWDGSRWRSAVLPSVPGDSSLSSVVALGPRDAWAVGSRSAPSEQIVATHPLVEHWDGTGWRVVAMPLPGAGAFNSVSADAPNDVWAAGWSVPAGTNRQDSEATMRPLVAHWNGRSWRVTHLPAPGADELSNVVALGADNAWVAGPGLYRTGAPIVRHWDGTSWRSIRAPFGTRDPDFSLTASSATDAWAVGGQETGGHSRTLAAHWNGRAWMIAPTPNQNTDSMLLDVHAISPADVWALGESQFMNHIGNETQYTLPVAIYEHWNGTRWSLAKVSSEREGLAFLTAAPDGTVWAAGGCYYQNIVTRWSGHAWQPVRHPPDITWGPHQPKQDRHPPATSCLSKSPA
jgi:hypothetical protein